MTLRTAVIAVTLALAAATLIAAWTFSRREPTCNGQPLSYWIDLNRRLHQYGSVPLGAERDVQEARAAITTIGTRGIPYLIRWIKPPLWGARFIRWAPRPSRRNLYRFNQERAERAEAAMQALEVLGTNAVSAIPELEALAMKTNIVDREIAWRAKRTLHNLGPQAFPALLNLWSNAGPADKRSPFYYGMRDLITNTPAQ